MWQPDTARLFGLSAEAAWPAGRPVAAR